MGTNQRRFRTRLVRLFRHRPEPVRRPYDVADPTTWPDDWECSQCGKVFKERDDADYHEHVAHPYFRRAPALTVSEVTCECGYCPGKNVLEPKKAYDSHRRTQHGDRKRPYVIQEEP